MVNGNKTSLEMKGELTSEGANEVAKIEAWGRVVNGFMSRLIWGVGVFVSPEFMLLIKDFTG